MTDVANRVGRAPLLSIVIPSMNESASITSTLESLQSLRSRHCEVIVVDGGSHDDTVTLATPLVDKVVVSSAGRAAQMNAGAHLASGCWLLFLHADTLLPLSMIDFLTSLSTTTRRWGFFALRLTGRHCFFRVIENAISLRSRLTFVATGDQALFVHQEMFKQLGGFPDQALMEDVAITKKLRQQNAPLFWSDPVLSSSRRWEKNGIMKTVILMWYLRFSYFYGASPEKLEKIYHAK